MSWFLSHPLRKGPLVPGMAHRPVIPAHTKRLEDLRLGYTDVARDQTLNHNIKINT